MKDATAVIRADAGNVLPVRSVAHVGGPERNRGSDWLADLQVPQVQSCRSLGGARAAHPSIGWRPLIVGGVATWPGDGLSDEEKSERATAMIADLSYAVWQYSPGTQRRCQEFACN